MRSSLISLLFLLIAAYPSTGHTITAPKAPKAINFSCQIFLTKADGTNPGEEVSFSVPLLQCGSSYMVGKDCASAAVGKVYQIASYDAAVIGAFTPDTAGNFDAKLCLEFSRRETLPAIFRVMGASVEGMKVTAAKPFVLHSSACIDNRSKGPGGSVECLIYSCNSQLVF